MAWHAIQYPFSIGFTALAKNQTIISGYGCDALIYYLSAQYPNIVWVFVICVSVCDCGYGVAQMGEQTQRGNLTKSHKTIFKFRS